MNTLFDLNSFPYSLNRVEKQKSMVDGLKKLTTHHKDNCHEYSSIITKIYNFDLESEKIEDIPFLPVSLFKQMELKSVNDNAVIKTLLSSGTSSQLRSKIYLDSYTSSLQQKTLFNNIQPIVGSNRLPMIIIDNKNAVKDRATFNARGAGILGFSIFGRDHFYLLDDQMQVDWDGLSVFLEKHKNEKILLFGFTYVIWKYLYQESNNKNMKIDFGDSILIHGGGWKNFLAEEVKKSTFNITLKDKLGIVKIVNYYGMIEQVGSIFFECEKGYFHTPNYADLLIRDPITFEVLPNRVKGIIQVFSLLPYSYPGHSLITEDLGEIIGEDDCQCGNKGKYFNVIGRLPSAEIRGCSDTQR